ncbi:MAG: diacylglycerol/lipid kinase family protein [Pseudonocardia sp.]
MTGAALLVPTSPVSAVLAVAFVLATLAAAILVVLRARRARSPEPTVLAAEPEDRPLPAVVAHPLRTADDARDSITRQCLELGWREPLWLETTADDPGTGQARAAVERGADVVMACGGDGTVRSVAQALAGTGVAMALLPTGTGNLLARTLGSPMELLPAVRAALNGDDRKVDVGWVRVDGAQEERAFLVMAGTGFDATIMEATPEALKVRVGTLAYVISGLRAMRGRRTRVTLTLDDGPPLRRRTRTVLVGNSGTLLGGLVLMPAATVDDGLLDVVNIAPKGLAGWVAVLVRVLTRRRRGHERVEHWQARSIVVAAEAPQASQIDGDPIGDVAELRIRVEQGALIVRVPDVEVPDPPPITNPKD